MKRVKRRRGRKKSGANGEVVLTRDTATKWLLQPWDKERFARFSNEVMALQAAKRAGVENIVEIHSTHLDLPKPHFIMRRYRGSVDDLLPLTRNNPAVIAKIMLPVVRALKTLSELSPPIFHRDLKPANILYAGPKADAALVIADFGCAFLANPKSMRLTESTRAVGATFYRAPEYSYGRVEAVTAAGDIFSIGKLLWYLCNGRKNEVFPYTLWYPQEFNLQYRCNAAGVTSLNLIIAACVSHFVTERPTYDELLSYLERLMASRTVSSDEVERTRMLAYEAEQEAKRREEAAVFLQMIHLLLEDIDVLATDIESRYEGTSLSANVREFTKLTQATEDLVTTVIFRNSDMPLCNWVSSDARFHVRLHTQYQAAQLGLPCGTFPAISIQGTVISQNSEHSEYLYLCRSGPQLVAVNGGRKDDQRPYSVDELRRFVFRQLSRIGQKAATLEPFFVSEQSTS